MIVILIVVNKVREKIKRINIRGSVRYDEPMATHSTFRVGGNAEIYIQPRDVEDVIGVQKFCKSEAVPLFILGGGANILVSDRGISGIVMDMTSLNRIEHRESSLTIEAGAPVSSVSAYAADLGLGGFDFIYAMPGSFGGAIWMNARCYDSEIADVLTRVTYLDENGHIQTMKPDRSRFLYKDTPFMKNAWIILSGTLSLVPANSPELWNSMKKYEEDRRSKGHFSAPCAGSVFKNNREFGAPSGQIIDSLGLRGIKIGGAQISPHHANIIVNQNNAKAQDIKDLIDLVQKEVLIQKGFRLEPEVLMVGEWQ